MDIAPKYDPRAIEDKWYAFWLEKKLFHSEPDDREPYTVVIPPPNVTGVLHMGHMLNNTIQDVLVRRARMMGKNACWVPGTDHASIATEAKVVNMLKEQGIDKRNIGRDEFMRYAWEWKEKHGGIILPQLRKLGASCDWDRTAFTMDEVRYESVINVFVDLYKKGLIYRGVRMVNWDPKALTAVSDEEVVYKESQSKLYYLRYYIDEPEAKEHPYIVVATTRPETILGDTAVCVHPEDERYSWLKGKRVVVPSVGRSVPIIMDEYVDREFGTGALKITPAHDVNDYNLGMKYHLDTIDIFNDNGTLNDNGAQYAGMDRFACRKQIVKDLEAADLIEKIEDYVNKVGHSERTDAVIEPKLSAQWFLKMNDIAQKALQVVEDDTIQFHPEKFKNTYRHWLENIKDWCISRQLWWGQRIPAYYLPNKEVVVATSQEEAFLLAQQQYPGVVSSPDQLQQDEDVLDTWFSSWLWPISLFDGIRHPDNKEINYYYPTNDLITAPDIIFFWVARMIMAGEEYRHNIPFKHVYFTGIVRDKLGRKMSKSLGNSPDPIMLIDKFGADGVRMGMMLSAPAGNDILFDESLCEQGRNFNNKIWNAFRLVKGWQVSEALQQPNVNSIAVNWFAAKLNKVSAEVDDLFSKYRISEALMAVYRLFWDEFSSWYLEMVKPAYVNGEAMPIDIQTYNATLHFFEILLKMLHPFMPFITEELWQHIYDRKEGESIMRDRLILEAPTDADDTLIQEIENVKQIVSGIRMIRSQKNIAPKEALDLQAIGSHPYAEYNEVLSKMANLNNITVVAEKDSTASAFMVGTQEYTIPLGDKIDVEAEIAKMQAQLEHLQGFLVGIKKKLSNEKFVAHAPEQVVTLERKKQSDSEEKIASLQEAIAQLKK